MTLLLRKASNLTASYVKRRDELLLEGFDFTGRLFACCGMFELELLEL